MPTKLNIIRNSRLIVGVADVSLGYANPQIARLMDSLMDYYQAEGLIFETDEMFRPPVHDRFPEITIERVKTHYDPWSGAGRVEYVTTVAKTINALRPDILVIYSTFSFPVLLKLRFRPKFIVYYCLEDVETYGRSDVTINHILSDLLDVIIFPEENRAVMETVRCGFEKVPKAVLYNTSNSESDNIQIVPPERRNGKIIYHGWIDKVGTLAMHYVQEEIGGIQIDLYGPITNVETDDLIEHLPHNIRYCGIVDSDTLSEIRKDYCFSIVMWNPTKPDRLYAAPNKFFESVAAGVPPITAPHPQCKMLTNRYGCGLVMESWSGEAFSSSVRAAMGLYRTADYGQMVSNCRRAFSLELNWERQFEKLVGLLKKLH